MRETAFTGISRSSVSAKGASDNCPDAALVFDRFHVMQAVGKAVDEVRRREHRSLLRKGDKSLRESMWLFRNNPQNLDEEQTAHLDNIKEANLITAKAYQMRLTLQDIYNLKEPTLFKKKLLAWCRWVKAYGKSKGYLFKPRSLRQRAFSTTSMGLSALPSPE